MDKIKEIGNKEVRYKREFRSNGKTFSAINEAERWLRMAGFRVAPMQYNNPKGIASEDNANFYSFGYIPKWDDMTEPQKFALDGIIVPDSKGFREADYVTVLMSKWPL